MDQRFHALWSSYTRVKFTARVAELNTPAECSPATLCVLHLQPLNVSIKPRRCPVSFHKYFFEIQNA